MFLLSTLYGQTNQKATLNRKLLKFDLKPRFTERVIHSFERKRTLKIYLGERYKAQKIDKLYKV